ncbi:MAG TPA: carboxyl transferase domain-containing protein [Clostridia bacterium]|nr:carboxyl transferase domain-containing protein [Clostridia bacterium]
MGGDKNVKRQHDLGKMTVRERIDAVVDYGSFRETGVMAGDAVYKENELESIVPCPIIMGTAKIKGRRVTVHGDDFTIKGASVGRLYKLKLNHIMKMAYELRLPMVRLLDGAGGSIKEILRIGHTELPVSKETSAQRRADLMSMVPIVSIGMGPVSGIGALLLVQSHFSIMVKEMCQVFVGGPYLVKAALYQDYTKEELGGYKLHSVESGVVDNTAESEEDAIEQAKRFLDYMPTNVWEMPVRKYSDRDEPDRCEEGLLSAVPKNRMLPYDMREILKMVFDKDSIFEIGRDCGKSQITALARLNGYPVGVLANDPNYNAGSFTWDVAEKFQRFIDMCDTFHLPVVNLVDQPGFFLGLEAEKHGTIRKGVRASFAVLHATVPWATIYVRKCFGVAGGAQSNADLLNWRYAWPSAVWGNIPVEGGVFAAHRAEIRDSDNPEALLEELMETYRGVASPFRTAEAFGIEDIIDPRDTRPLLCEWVEMVYPIEKTRLGIKTRGIRC